MKATTKQAVNNERNLELRFSGHGHYKISCDYYGKRISCITTNMPAVDNFRSYYDEPKKIREGYNSLVNEIIRNNYNLK